MEKYGGCTGLYLRILFSSFGEDFKTFALNNYAQIVFGYYFAEDVGDATSWTNLN